MRSFVSTYRVIVATLTFALLLQMLAATVAIRPAAAADRALAEAPAGGAFERTWSRTDKVVADGQATRTWMWGPEANTGTLTEPYTDAPGGQRTVQYYDKSRMEDNAYRGTNPWDVTNGLLVVELISGQRQVGDDEYEPGSPAQVPVAGDSDDPTGPTYATFTNLRNAAPLAGDSTIIQRVSRDGTVSNDGSFASYGVTAAHYTAQTNHQVASPFWDFMNATGTIYENGNYTTGQLFQDPYYATGFPITEAYWAEVKVGGTYRDVLMQCFERRCLTYTPGNDAAWQVEAGNVGLHYYSWRLESGQTASSWIDAASGGSVEIAGQVRVEIPAGALNQSTAVTVSRTSLTTQTSLMNHSSGSPGRFYDIDTSGVLLNEPASIHFTLDNSLIHSGEAFVLHFDDSRSEWQLLDHTITGSSSVSVSVQAFSLFGIPSINELVAEWADEYLGINWQWLLGIPKQLDCPTLESAVAFDNQTLGFVKPCVMSASDVAHPRIRFQNVSLWEIEIAARTGAGIPQTIIKNGDSKEFNVDASDGYPIEAYVGLADNSEELFLFNFLLSVFPFGGKSVDAIKASLSEAEIQELFFAFLDHLGNKHAETIANLINAMNRQSPVDAIIAMLEVVRSPDVLNAMITAFQTVETDYGLISNWLHLGAAIVRAAVGTAIGIAMGLVGSVIGALVGGTSFLQMLFANMYSIYRGKTISIVINGPSLESISEGMIRACPSA